MGNLIVAGGLVAASKTGTGASLGGVATAVKVRNEPERAYKLRKLEISCSLNAPGAGYAYGSQWSLQRRIAEVDPFGTGFLPSPSNSAQHKSGEQNVIAAGLFHDGDSYGYYGHLQGAGRPPWVFEWDKDDAPVFLDNLNLYSWLYVTYDGTPSRSFVMLTYMICSFENWKVDRQKYNELAAFYSAASLR